MIVAILAALMPVLIRHLKYLGEINMGPLKDIKIIEMAGIGPARFLDGLLDMGAEVISVENHSWEEDQIDIASRGKKSMAVDIKQVKKSLKLLNLLMFLLKASAE